LENTDFDFDFWTDDFDFDLKSF